MMKRGILASMVLALLVAVSAPLVAHHALQAEFDTSKRGAFTGVLTKFSMINPHVRWYFDVAGPNGTMTKWEVIGAGPQALRDNGLTRIFKAGETLKVTYAPARDGSNLGRVVTFTFPDGRVITLYHDDPNNPNDR